MMNQTDLSLYQPALPALLAERAVEYLAHAQAPNTKRAYASAWTHFTFFCRAHGADALPASVATVAAYLTYLAQGFLDGYEEWEVQAVTGHKSRAVLQKYNRRQEQAQARVIRGVLKNGKPRIDTARESV